MTAALAQPPAWLLQGFRPFFLAAGVWSIIALSLWIAMLSAGLVLPSRFDPLTWHVHEMLFGFVMAAIAGFLLTAIPNWTQRAALSGAPLAALAGLWLLGRLACLFSALVPPWLGIAADVSFPLALLTFVTREIVAAKAWRNLPVILPVGVLGATNLLIHFQADGIADVPSGLGWRLALAATVILVSVIAGRILPAFTRNWLMKRNGSQALPLARLPAPNKWVDIAALVTLHIGLLGWAIAPSFGGIGLLLLVAAALNLWRLIRWRGIATVAEPLLFLLHIAYAWLASGAALLGLTVLGLHLPLGAAVHALSVGAISQMILAVMMRATLGHTGRTLLADRTTVLIFLVINLAAISRVSAGYSGQWLMPILMISAALWVAAFVLFTCHYGPNAPASPADRLIVHTNAHAGCLTLHAAAY